MKKQQKTLLLLTISAGLTYYFFIYLPKQKQVNSPLTTSHATQTELNPDNSELEQSLLTNLKNLNQQI